MAPAPAPASASAPVPAPPRWLRVVALAELLTLTVLLFNVALVHDAQVAAAVGPVHGGCYLTVIIGLLAREGTNEARLLALLPGIGGLLGLRALNQARAPRRLAYETPMSHMPKDDRSAQVCLTDDRLPKGFERWS